jgi:hypothetical protein
METWLNKMMNLRMLINKIEINKNSKNIQKRMRISQTLMSTWMAWVQMRLTKWLA